MKKMNKIFALLLTAVMVLGMSISVFAASENSISVVGAKDGETYNVYRMLDLSVNNQTDPTSYRYTINDTWEDFWTTGEGKNYIDTNTSGTDTYVVWKEDKKSAADMEAFGKAAARWAQEKNIAPEKPAVTAANGTAGWTGLDNGYYLVTSTYGTAVSIASTPAKPAQTISEKNSENTADKDVQEKAERNGTETAWSADKNDAQIGDEIHFRTKVSIAKDTINLVYHDTLDSGLTWSGAATTKVFTDPDLMVELLADNYTVASGTDGETFTVTFKDDYIARLTAASTDVYIGYSAVLNDDAVVDSPQKNTANVTWGDKGKSSTTTTETYTRRFEILKYDGADADRKPLANARFQLYTSETAGTALTLAKNEDGSVYRVVDLSDQGASLPDGYTLAQGNEIVTLASGNITIEGVDSDDYYLEETEAPVGFNKLTARVKVSVNDNNKFVSEIVNNSGNILPSTGGMGTTIFYIIGAVLVIGAGVILVTRRRMNEK